MEFKQQDFPDFGLATFYPRFIKVGDCIMMDKYEKFFLIDEIDITMSSYTSTKPKPIYTYYNKDKSQTITNILPNAKFVVFRRMFKR